MFWTLFRLTVNNTFGLSAARYRYFVKKKNLWEIPVVGIPIGGVLVALSLLVYTLARGFVTAGLQVGQPQIVFTFALVVLAILTFVSGIASVVSMFFFSNDLPTLVPLPLRPSTIVQAKFAAVLLTEYLEVLLILLPMAIAYAQLVGGGLVYWLAVLLVFLAVPIVPLALASALSLLLMRFINRRHRDVLLVVFSLAFVAVVLWFQMSFISMAPEGDPTAFLREVLAGKVSLVNLIGQAYPPAAWGTNVIAGPGALARLGSLLGFLGLSGAALWVMNLAGGRFFYAGLIGGTELARRRLTAEQRTTARAKAEARTVQGGVVRALFWREWRLFMRVPLYVMNGFLASFIVPVLFLAPATIKDPEIQALLKALTASGNAAFFSALVLAALIVFLVSLNTTSSSAISREGKTLWISKVIPALPEQQVQGKLLFAAAGAVVSALPVVVIAGLALKMSLVRLAWALPLGLLASAVVLLLGLLYDMARPYLKWTNPQQAVKNNLNVIIPLPVAVGLLAVMGLLAIWLYNGIGLTELATVGILAAVLVALFVPAYRVTVAAAKRLYERLEP